MKVTVAAILSLRFAESVLDAELPARDDLKRWGNSSPSFLESSQPIAFSRDEPASLR